MDTERSTSNPKFEPWQIYSLIFLTFWILIACIDNFFFSLFLCIFGGLAVENLNDSIKKGEKKYQDKNITQEKLEDKTNDADNRFVQVVLS